MAKILYGVAGEGLGHAIRSRPIIDHLKKNHKVKVVAAHHGYHYLKKHADTEEIDYFKIIYRNNKAANILTFLNNLVRSPIILFKALKVGKIIKNYKPDIIITDFEPITNYYAFFKRIPVISIDNQHLITEAAHDPISNNLKLSAFITRLIINSFIIKRSATIITAIVPAKSNQTHFHIIDPILRSEIIKVKPKKGKHILVYQTSKSNKELEPTLLNIPDQQFIVYGFQKNKKLKNIQYKEASEKKYLEDLRTAKAVITNGGFTLISEAIHLKKPILTIPIVDQFEQQLNSIHVHMLGFGMMEQEISEYAVDQFLKNLPEYEFYLKKHIKFNNKDAFRMIDKEVSSLIKKNS